MKIYLASNFELKNKVETLSNYLEAMGHEITVKWWHSNTKEIRCLDHDWYLLDEVKEVSIRNFAGIKRADAVVLVCPNKEKTKFNGANVEVGYALALGKPVFSWGILDRSAMYCPIIKCRYVLDLGYELKQHRLAVEA
jgi:nucleoside 2-deoxyribosyltransferase